MGKIKMIANTAMFTVKKYSPEILLGIGFVGIGVSTVLACKATLKVEEVLDVYETTMENVDLTLEISAERNDDTYTLADAKKDRITIKTQTAVQFVKIYGPSATLMVASMGCILGSYRIMSKRQIALMAAYKVMEEAFTTYRGRVINELGEVKDAHFMYGTDTITDEETVVDENGKSAVVHLPKGYKIEDIKLENMFKEKKNKRLQVLMYPTQYNRMKNYCESNNIKINSFINEAIKYYLDKQIEEIKKQQQ